LKILAVDTCCAAATAAVLDGEILVAQTVINDGKMRSENLMPQIERMLALCGTGISGIDVFAAAAGPGSFTGVRIGVAAVKAMASVDRRPCVGVSTLRALANNLPFSDGVICPILDARRDQVYNALFKYENGRLERLCPDRALALPELLGELESEYAKLPVSFVGDGVPVYREELSRRLGERARFAPPHLCMNLAGSAAEIAMEMAKRGETVPYGDLVPNYVRLSQAEQTVGD